MWGVVKLFDCFRFQANDESFTWLTCRPRISLSNSRISRPLLRHSNHVNFLFTRSQRRWQNLLSRFQKFKLHQNFKHSRHRRRHQLNTRLLFIRALLRPVLLILGTRLRPWFLHRSRRLLKVWRLRPVLKNNGSNI